MPHPSVKYSPLGSDREEPNSKEPEAAFNFSSTFTYDTNPDVKYKSAFSYGGDQQGSRGDASVNMDHLGHDQDVTSYQQPFWLNVTCWVLTFFSYVFFVLTLPVTYWVFVKKMGEFDRIVVFRLGKVIGVKGPGRFIIFPWMDRAQKIDIRASAFAVPPQQFITADGGIVEMGAEIQFGIVDVVTMIREVTNHQEILRSLGNTLMIKILVKKTVSQLGRDKRVPEREIMDEINDQVRKWGINVHSVALSEAKILKQPESGGDGAVGSILRGLGMKGESKFPTPQEFVRGMDNYTSPAATTPSLNISILQGLATSGKMPTIGEHQENLLENDNSSVSINWARYMEEIINAELTGPVDDDACGLYKIEISESENEKQVFFIDLSSRHKIVYEDNKLAKDPDVSVNLSSADLASILNGSLAPLQAFLTGRITAQGDVKKLMFFDKLSNKSRKPASAFNI